MTDDLLGRSSVRICCGGVRRLGEGAFNGAMTARIARQPFRSSGLYHFSKPHRCACAISSESSSAPSQQPPQSRLARSIVVSGARSDSVSGLYVPRPQPAPGPPRG